jgi:hypothetical protein
MMRQRIQSALGTWRGRFRVALVVLILFVVSGYTAGYVVTTYGATSLEITVWKYAAGQYPNPIIFHKTITNLGLVSGAQDQIDGVPEFSGPVFCPLAPLLFYLYQFRFATGSHTTQVYEGTTYCVWSTTPFGIAWLLNPIESADVSQAKLDGVEILLALHQKTGMPLPVPPVT